MQPGSPALDSRAFGLAAGGIAALLSALCALLLTLSPTGTRALLGLLIHSDASAMPVVVTWTSAIVSIVGWGIGTGLVFSAAAGVYNRLAFRASVATAPPIRSVES